MEFANAEVPHTVTPSPILGPTKRLVATILLYFCSCHLHVVPLGGGACSFSPSTRRRLNAIDTIRPLLLARCSRARARTLRVPTQRALLIVVDGHWSTNIYYIYRALYVYLCTEYIYCVRRTRSVPRLERGERLSKVEQEQVFLQASRLRGTPTVLCCVPPGIRYY